MQADVAPFREDAYGNLSGCFLLDLHINVGDAMLYHHLKSSSSDRQRIHLSIFPWKAFVACRGIREGFSGPLPPLRSRGNKSKSTSNG